jgi:quercetin dioxygenase-like cupin family protein
MGMNRMFKSTRIGVFAAAASCAVFAGLIASAGVVVKPRADLKWSEAAIPGVSTAAVDGDMTKGASRFFLKYKSGLVTPQHHHSADHFVTTVAGNLVVIADGKEHKLPPGSYFAFTGKAVHATRCEGAEDCVMFIEARGPWDVVPAQPAKP